MAEKQRYRAELFDKVNYMCRKYMDRMARVRIDYGFIIDEKAFKETVAGFLGKAAVFRSEFVGNYINPYWVRREYDIDDCVITEHPEDAESAAYEFFMQEIPTDSNLQIKFKLIYSEGTTALCMMWNHMCMDGGGFKSFYAALCRNYTALVTEGRKPDDFSDGERGFTEVYADMPSDKRVRAKLKLAPNFAPKNKTLFPFTKEEPDDSTVLITKRIPADIFIKAKAAAKRNNATVNDMLIASYIGALQKLNTAEDFTSSVSGAVDLRRYIKNPDSLGYTNHTAFMYASANTGGGMKSILNEVSECTRAAKRDDFMGLHGLPSLNLGYHITTYTQAELVIRLFYKNPPYAVSNVGSFDSPDYYFCGNKPTAMMVAGAAKNKPCAMMTAATLGNVLTVSMCIKGNSKDADKVREFFGGIEECLTEISSF